MPEESKKLWDSLSDEQKESVKEWVENFADVFVRAWEKVKDVVKSLMLPEEDCRVDYGETDDCHWVWDVTGNRLAYIRGDYYYGDVRVNVTKNKEGEIIKFEAIEF